MAAATPHGAGNVIILSGGKGAASSYKSPSPPGRGWGGGSFGVLSPEKHLYLFAGISIRHYSTYMSRKKSVPFSGTDFEKYNSEKSVYDSTLCLLVEQAQSLRRHSLPYALRASGSTNSKDPPYLRTGLHDSWKIDHDH